jgi:peroxiredoxin
MTALAIIAVSVTAQSKMPKSATEAKPLKAGILAPDAQNIDVKATTVKSALGGKPTVVVFYRGGWCPFCNAHLAELGRSYGELTKLGYQLFAISPDASAALKKTLGDNQITYRLYSDSKAEAMIKFGVAYRLNDNDYGQYKKMAGVDLETYSGAKHHVLPVPSVFIINKTGKIVFVHSDPNYRLRLSGRDLIAAAKKNR